MFGQPAILRLPVCLGWLIALSCAGYQRLRHLSVGLCTLLFPKENRAFVNLPFFQRTSIVLVKLLLLGSGNTVKVPLVGDG